MKKLIFLLALSLIAFSAFGQLQVQSDTLYVPAVDSVFSFNGFAPSGLSIEIDFTEADAFDSQVTLGGSKSKFDQLYGAWQTDNNPVVLNLTNFPDTIARIERTVGHFYEALDVYIEPGSVTEGKKYPITIYFDRF